MDEQRRQLDELNTRYFNLLAEFGERARKIDAEIAELERRKLRLIQRQQFLNDEPITDLNGNDVTPASHAEWMKFYMEDGSL